MTNKEQYPIRPYARLLTMLGDQLIKNERIALVELIKNAYDADSPWVKVSFNGFDENLKNTPELESKIIIEDAGEGMTLGTITKHWLNPATPDKKRRKAENEKTSRGRVIQGEKGIGRFAILKLGRKIKIITRAKDEDEEHVINYDFSIYDDEFLSENGNHKDIFLDEISITVESRAPKQIVEKSISFGNDQITRLSHGTIIEISDLKGKWSTKKTEEVYRDITRLEPIFSEMDIDSGLKIKEKEFEVKMHADARHLTYDADYKDELKALIENNCVLNIENGFFDDKKKCFSFTINGVKHELSLFDPSISSSVFKSRFGNAAKVLNEREIECGPFRFGFYIFDLNKDADKRYELGDKQKKILKQHRVYLYRDGIRVYPYGEAEDDWLRIDILRGTKSAGGYLSNDQIFGYVNITQKDNPNLKDKTNREGLIEEGDATEDLIVLLQTILVYIRKGPYARYRLELKDKNEQKNAQDILKNAQVDKEFYELKKATKDNKKVHDLAIKAEKLYHTERDYLKRRAETTEDLAGVGLSVETASHDIMAIMERCMMQIDSLIKTAMHSKLNKDNLLEDMQSLRGMLSFIEAQLKDIQLLFRSTKKRRKNIKVKDVIEKVERIYTRLLTKENIEFEINVIGSPLVAKTTDAVLLQLFLNLFDNSVYWLQQVSSTDKKIQITLDGDSGELIFSDNGPGIEHDDIPYIFEPFYSGKGEDGRGLGLYIARQLLERNGFSINLAELNSEKILSGVNFVVSFVGEDK
ncbi:ATP-binding protein [Methanolobus mangrovi]|uniref:histidine kinase n=1 Tax=Methanolobus mangrovi TaxID=3072977 RepID=A0AA51UGY6_9EURY|nr:ATP-binding protein [Methanolobus mangrovi]WMW22778.1 ATP-binding protein [Methanolobus mangrovi]